MKRHIEKPHTKQKVTFQVEDFEVAVMLPLLRTTNQRGPVSLRAGGDTGQVTILSCATVSASIKLV